MRRFSTFAETMVSSITLRVSSLEGGVDALLCRPVDARWLLLLAHGAGAGMHHSFMEHLAGELAGCRVATLRYQFPYMQNRRKRPDPPAVLTATVRAAVMTALDAAPDLPLLAGGKSFGGRMTSLAIAEERSAESPGMASVRGLVFLGFPLHQAGRPGIQRAEHLARVPVPMLFLQGTRDALADLALLRPLCDTLVPLSTLHLIDGADHSFHVLKRSGKSDAGVLAELARTVASWADALG
jgi:uncharacterized protein